MTPVSKTYPVTADKLKEMCTTIKDKTGVAIDPTQTTGSEVTHGVHLAWSIHTDRIVITVIDKPWVVPIGTIWGELDPLFA